MYQLQKLLALLCEELGVLLRSRFIQHPITEGRQIALEAKVSTMETICQPLSSCIIALEDVFQL